MNTTDPIVIVGGGHAGIQLCAALVDGGCMQPIHLVSEEADLPYQRPPLSKDFLRNAEAALQLHKTEAWLAEKGVVLHRQDPAAAIDRERRMLTLRSGAQLPYAHLVLATGARPRLLPGLSPALANVAVLRNAEDARRLRGLIASCERLTIVGGGFIGLEVAVSAQALGKQVTVLEAAPRLLGRAASPEIAAYLLEAHRARGIDVRVGVRIEVPPATERLETLVVDGVTEPVDVLLLGIGAVPETSLAEAAGLLCDNGILVDAELRSSDPAILAIGDCANAPHGDGARLRLESVPNAADQARAAAALLLGKPLPAKPLPWFWSDQGLRLQIAGLAPADSQRYRRPGAKPDAFSILHYVGERLVAVESINAAPDHIAARKLLDKGLSPAPALACDPATSLASFLV